MRRKKGQDEKNACWENLPTAGLYKHQATLAKGQLLSRNFIQLTSIIGAIKLHRKDTKWQLYEIFRFDMHIEGYTQRYALTQGTE